MSEHFVKYINIDKYKCFSGFSAEGFGRVNLISGKNNVGKTVLLEALFVNICSQDTQQLIQSFNSIYTIRTKLDQTPMKTSPEKVKDVFDNRSSLMTNVNKIGYSFDESDIVKGYEINVGDYSGRISITDMAQLMNEDYIFGGSAYIGSIRDSQSEIIHSFEAIQKKDRESEVNKYIQQFDNSIENMKVIGNSIECKVANSDGGFMYRNITEFGDGLRHYISVISDLFLAEGRYIFIDEIDNGIHYSSLNQLWEIIFTLSKELNVQVFATTHSSECIDSYCRVAEKLKEQDISFTTLVKNKEKAVKAIVRDYEVFTDSIHDEREVRGW